MTHCTAFLAFTLFLPTLGYASTKQDLTSSRDIVGHAPWKDREKANNLAINSTPFVYFGEVVLADRSCSEWREEFDKRFDGIDDSRVASLAFTTCYNDPDHRRLKYEGLIEPWTEADVEYLVQFISQRQNFPVIDHKIEYRRALGVIFDFQAEYLDKNGNTLAQLGSQELTFGAPNSHSLPFDFEAAERAMDGSIHENFLPFIAATFGEGEKVLTERLYLPFTKTLILRSALRFQFADFSVKKMPYWGSIRENGTE